MDASPPSFNLVPVGAESAEPHYFRLVHPYAYQLRDLRMQRVDLELVCTWLTELGARYPRELPPSRSIHDEAFWTAAIIAFFRCFTPSARGQLDAKRVFASEPDGAMQAYVRLNHFRNRTVAHDESFFNQGFVGVPVHNPEGPAARVGPVAVIVMKASIFDFEEISNLSNLSVAAIRWIDDESAKLETALNEEVRKMSRAQVIDHGPVQWTSPSFDNAGGKRQRR